MALGAWSLRLEAWSFFLSFFNFAQAPERLDLKTRTFSCPNLYWSCLRRNCSRKQNRAKEAFAPLVNCGPVRTHWIPSLSRRFWRARGVDNVKPCPILSFNILHVKLGAWSLVLGAWSLRLEAWSLELVARARSRASSWWSRALHPSQRPVIPWAAPGPLLI